jgi:hypothetical protein
VGTDFTGASMTGVCLEAWNIESSTKLDEVDCQYVYLLENPKPRTDDRERRPSSGVFQPQEFTKLFEEVLDTVDFIFQNGIDWKAFMQAFKQVQVENEDTPLDIQSIENKGDGVVVVKVKVPPETNKENIHQDFTQNYDTALQLLEEKYKMMLSAKDEQIENERQKYSNMMEITKLLANKESIVNVNVENTAMAESNQDKIQMNVSGGQVGQMVGKVEDDFNVNASPEQKQNLAEAAKEIQQLLTQLDQSYPTDTVAGQMQVAQEVMKEIEQNMPLGDRLLSAIRAGGTEALKQTLNHPAATFVLALIDDWQKTKINN